MVAKRMPKDLSCHLIRQSCPMCHLMHRNINY
jgi:hypothetical protein